MTPFIVTERTFGVFAFEYTKVGNDCGLKLTAMRWEMYAVTARRVRESEGYRLLGTMESGYGLGLEEMP